MRYSRSSIFSRFSLVFSRKILIYTTDGKQNNNNDNYIYYNFFYQGKTPGASKITKENYDTCLEVNPTLAGRHQRNHHAAKPN